MTMPTGDRRQRTQASPRPDLQSDSLGEATVSGLSAERGDYLDLIVAAEKVGYARGRASILGASYPEGFGLGFDHGYGATQAARPLVRGIIDGFEEGLAERHRMLEQIRDRARIRHLAGKAAAR